jgi:hypothetical protein
MNGLEKIIKVGKDIGKTIKKNGKKALIILSLPFLINNNVGAGSLGARIVSSLNNPYCKIQHITGATEGFDNNGLDAMFPPFPFPPTIDFYSKIDFDPYRLKIDARPPESTSTFNLEISGRGLLAPESANLEFIISHPQGEDNFRWKTIIGELSQRIDDGEGSYKYAQIGYYDVKNRVISTQAVPVTINNGITQGEFFPSHKLNYHFFNHADLNRDRKVNIEDFAILADNWGRTGIAKGSDPNNLNDYADIHDIYDEGGNLISYGDGKVDYEDLGNFCAEWLWDANDPNTW